jgi:protein TonB
MGGQLTAAVPRYLVNPAPAYPAAARRRNQEGTVIVSASVNERGRVESAEVKESSGSRVLDAAALKAVHGWEFEPARRGAAAVASTVEVPVIFKLTP